MYIKASTGRLLPFRFFFGALLMFTTPNLALLLSHLFRLNPGWLIPDCLGPDYLSPVCSPPVSVLFLSIRSAENAKK
jgi:hypothetical protein